MILIGDDAPCFKEGEKTCKTPSRWAMGKSFLWARCTNQPSRNEDSLYCLSTACTPLCPVSCLQLWLWKNTNLTNCPRKKCLLDPCRQLGEALKHESCKCYEHIGGNVGNPVLPMTCEGRGWMGGDSYTLRPEGTTMTIQLDSSHTQATDLLPETRLKHIL